MKDEFKINIDTYSLKLGGGVYRSKCCSSRDWLFILESLNVECVVDIFHIDDWIYFRLVLAWLPFISKIEGVNQFIFVETN